MHGGKAEITLTIQRNIDRKPWKMYVWRLLYAPNRSRKLCSVDLCKWFALGVDLQTNLLFGTRQIYISWLYCSIELLQTEEQVTHNFFWKALSELWTINTLLWKRKKRAFLAQNWCVLDTIFDWRDGVQISHTILQWFIDWKKLQKINWKKSFVSKEKKNQIVKKY